MWYRKAGRAGNGNALAGIGELYQNGNGVPRDYAEARSWYRKVADAGSPAGMRDLLGLSYRDGLDVDKDAAVARQWLYKAADLGDTRAMVEYGDLIRPLGERLWQWNGGIAPLPLPGTLMALLAP